MSKVNDFWILFDEKISISSCESYLKLFYRIDDNHCFLKFYSDTKEFVESTGFGRDDKHYNPDWWKDPSCDWKDMGK